MSSEPVILFGIARNKAPPFGQNAVCLKRSEYGIVFKKDLVIQRKGNPILYAYKNQPLANAIKKLITKAGANAADPIWEVTPFIDAPSTYPSGSYFFEWEREWRKLGDFKFTTDDVAFLIIPEHLHQMAKVFFKNVRDENLGPVYDCPFIAPHWTQSKIKAALPPALTAT